MSDDKFKYKYSDIIEKTIDGFDNNGNCNVTKHKKCKKINKK